MIALAPLPQPDRLTARLRLRPLREEDWPNILAYQQDARYLRYYPWESRNEKAVRRFTTELASGWTEEPQTRYEFGIIRRCEPGRVVGVMGLRLDRPNAAEAELGFEIDPALWGRGYASEAARSIATLAFENMGLHLLWASCIAENTASLRVLEKLGFGRDLLLPQNRWMKDRWWDRHICRLPRETWYTRSSQPIAATA